MGTMLKKLNPYTIRKGLRYFKHYGPKEFWVRLHERFEPEEVPYGPWYEAYIPDDTELEKQRKHKFSYSPADQQWLFRHFVHRKFFCAR